MRAVEVDPSALREDVHIVRCGEFGWLQRAAMEIRVRAVIGWLRTEESASTGRFAVLYGKKGEWTSLLFLFDDVNTAFNTKMRWGS